MSNIKYKYNIEHIKRRLNDDTLPDKERNLSAVARYYGFPHANLIQWIKRNYEYEKEVEWKFTPKAPKRLNNPNKGNK